MWETISCPQFCHVGIFTNLVVRIQAVRKPTDVAKVAIKSEKLTPFGGIFFKKTKKHLEKFGCFDDSL